MYIHVYMHGKIEDENFILIIALPFYPHRLLDSHFLYEIFKQFNLEKKSNQMKFIKDQIRKMNSYLQRFRS